MEGSKGRPASGGTGDTAATDGLIIPGPTGQQMTIKVSGAATNGAYSLIEYSHSPAAQSPCEPSSPDRL